MPMRVDGRMRYFVYGAACITVVTSVLHSGLFTFQAPMVDKTMHQGVEHRLRSQVEQLTEELANSKMETLRLKEHERMVSLYEHLHNERKSLSTLEKHAQRLHSRRETHHHGKRHGIRFPEPGHVLILYWTHFFGTNGTFESSRVTCNGVTVQVTHDRSKVHLASAIVFHARGFDVNDLPERTPDQKWIFETQAAGQIIQSSCRNTVSNWLGTQSV